MEISYNKLASARFFSKVEIKSWKGCWNWQGSTVSSGRGKYGQMKFENKNYLAHRLVLKFMDVEIPKDTQVLHICDNMLCVNPSHLFFGSHQDNMTDKAIKARTSRILTPEQVKVIKYSPRTNGSIRAYAELFNVNRRTIQDIFNEKTWKHI